MSFEDHSKKNVAGIAVACVATVGAAVALAVWLRAAQRSAPLKIVERCRRSMEELEQRVLSSVQA